MVTIVAPARDLDQRMEALANANRIRVNRAVLKKQIAAGAADPVVFLLDPPEWLLSMKVEKFLRAVPKLGVVNAPRLMRGCGISLTKTVGGLSERQRGVLVGVLNDRLGGRGAL